MYPLASITEVCAVSRFETKSCARMSAQSTFGRGVGARPAQKQEAPVDIGDGVGDVLFEHEREVAGVALHLDAERRPVLADEGEGGDPEAEDERRAESDHGLPEQPRAARRDQSDARQPAGLRHGAARGHAGVAERRRAAAKQRRRPGRRGGARLDHRRVPTLCGGLPDAGSRGRSLGRKPAQRRRDGVGDAPK